MMLNQEYNPDFGSTFSEKVDQKLLVSMDDIDLQKKTKCKIDLDKLNITIPDDVLKTIYDDHFSPEHICKKLENIINSSHSKSLNYFELGDYLENVVFKNPAVIHKLKKENPLFLHIYKDEIVNKTKTFKKFTNTYNSFALAWLMTLYH